MSSLKFSIVTCSYQQGRFLDATMRSVLDQGYPNLEYIVIDGGSKDQSVQVIESHSSRLSYWVSEKDRGQTHALSKGFERATGDILGWLCSDDLLLPGALQRVARFFEAHPEVDFVYGNAFWIDAQGQFIRPKKEMPWNKFIFLFDHNYVAQPATFWRRSLFEKVGGLDESLNLAMDSDLWLRFAQHAQPHYLDEYLACMRDYPEQKTRALQPAGRKEDRRLIEREMPGLANWPQKPLKWLARASRIAVKLSHGGYGAQPPADFVKALDQYRIG
ncbi:MAG: glycosyltransferase [Burkholderiales bacterium]|nr:glycosyltransferase [Burkholderiales bacterium]